MLTIKLIFLLTIFILTQGIVFADKFKDNKPVLALGGLFVLLSSVLLSNEVKGIVGETNGVTIVIYLLLGGVTLFSFLHIFKMQQISQATQKPISLNNLNNSEINALKKKKKSEKALKEKKKWLNEDEKSKAIREGKIVVIDGVMYQNINFDSVGAMTYEEAETYAKNLRLGGIEGWRLPTREELHKIANIELYGEEDDDWKEWFDRNEHKRVEYNHGGEHFIKDAFIKTMPSLSLFWTSEKKDSSSCWAVSFYIGSYDWHLNIDRAYVMCVLGFVGCIS